MVVKLTSHETGKIRLSVTDNGTGISPDNLSKLFGAFFTTKQQGMGIGLAICKSIVEAHGGTLTAHNNEFGGATFDVVLPLFSPLSEQTVLAKEAI
jgi:signal transduction histidine kinase